MEHGRLAFLVKPLKASSVAIVDAASQKQHWHMLDPRSSRLALIYNSIAAALRRLARERGRLTSDYGQEVFLCEARLVFSGSDDGDVPPRVVVVPAHYGRTTAAARDIMFRVWGTTRKLTLGEVRQVLHHVFVLSAEAKVIERLATSSSDDPLASVSGLLRRLLSGVTAAALQRLVSGGVARVR